MLKINAGDDSDGDDLGYEPAARADGFSLSQSGAFTVKDFRINTMGLAPLVESDSSVAKTLSSASVRRGLNVESIEDLEMLEELGSGMSGTVWSALHKPTGVIMAVKKIQILEKAKRDQAISELRIMRKHECPWLVSLFNAFYEDTKVYTVLEFMDAGSIATLVEKHRDEGLRDERELAKIALQMLNGLNYLHRQHHQVHRDLKPANVMLSKAGAVKISDFGISSQLENTGGFCSTFIGSACYMSPERLAGEQYSYAADIWSFGLIMLELASGRYPYPSTPSYFMLLGHIMDDAAPTLPEGDFSDAFGEFVSLCLDKDPKRRPAASDLLKHQFVRSYPVLDDLLLSGLLEGMSL